MKMYPPSPQWTTYGMGLEAHALTELRYGVVLKTPNLVLGVDDIPPRHNRALDDNIKYPDGQWYTLQWLHGLHKRASSCSEQLRCNVQKIHSHTEAFTHALHYNYGGRCREVVGSRRQLIPGDLKSATMPRLSVPVPCPQRAPFD
ncbi:hypothetical protein B0H14DRAFT_3539811 [Mycena olivaceomarginata]|nr:hypothetical protein B0H14DRAFT_3539811 [Mycena olivaceomarginata]